MPATRTKPLPPARSPRELLLHFNRAFPPFWLKAAVLLLVLRLELSSDLVFLLGLLFIVLPVGFIWLLLFDRTPWGQHAQAWVIISLLLVATALPLENWLQAETERRGTEIGDALEAYRAANGTYPQQLDQLTPRYLPHIPRTAFGFFIPHDFHYRRYDDASFELSFGYWGSTTTHFGRDENGKVVWGTSS